MFPSVDDNTTHYLQQAIHGTQSSKSSKVEFLDNLTRYIDG